MRHSKRIIICLVIVLISISLSACANIPELAAPGVTLTVDPKGSPQQVSTGIQLLVLLTVLSIAPSVLLMTTSFTRIVIVMSMLRNALGTPTVPPNQVVIGLALILTFFIMSPVFNKIDQQSLQPYLKGEIDQNTALSRTIEPMREFMYKQTREQDIELFLQISGSPAPKTLADIPNTVILPAFIISELRTAFTMAFIIYIPFLIIDMVIASVLLAMGMMMLPPSLISMPFKLLLFVMVDGWYLITRSIAMSFTP